MADRWYVARNGTQAGPLTADQLRAKVVSGEVSASDLVWAEGMAQWQTAGQAGLAGPAAAAGPVPPVPPPPNAAARPSSAPALPVRPLARPPAAPPEPAAAPAVLPDLQAQAVRKPAKELAAVLPHEELDKAARGLLSTFMVLPTVVGVLGVLVVGLLAAIVYPKSVLLTVPLLAIIGVWTVIVAVRIKSSLQGGIVAGSFSEMGRLSTLLLAIGASPLLLILFGMCLLSRADEDRGNLLVRFIMVFYSIVVLPLAGYTLVRVRQVVGRPSQP